MKLKLLIGSCAVFTALAVSANAGSCGYDYCWGAVAFNPDTGAYGFAHSYFSEGQAASAAQEACSYNCPELKTFANQCGAAAIGNNGGFGWGVGNSRYDAESTAISYCTNYDYGCQVLVWSCSQ